MLSLAVYFDRLDAHGTLSATRPGLMFRPPDHPGVLVRPAATVTTLGGTPGDRILSERLAFQRGKSCLLTWPEDEPQTLRLELYYLDVAEDDASDATQPGRGVLLGMATHVISLVDEALKMVCVPLCDLVGNPVATLYARIRSQRLGQSLYPHLMQVPAAPATAQSALPTTLPAAELRHPPPSAPSAAPPPAPKPQAAVSKPSLPSATVPIIADSAAVPRVPAAPAASAPCCSSAATACCTLSRRLVGGAHGGGAGRAACSGRGEHHGARSKRPSRFWCAAVARMHRHATSTAVHRIDNHFDRSGGQRRRRRRRRLGRLLLLLLAAAAMTAAPVTSTAAPAPPAVPPAPRAAARQPPALYFHHDDGEAEDTPPLSTGAPHLGSSEAQSGPAPSHAAAHAVHQPTAAAPTADDIQGRAARAAAAIASQLAPLPPAPQSAPAAPAQVPSAWLPPAPPAAPTTTPSASVDLALGGAARAENARAAAWRLSGGSSIIDQLADELEYMRSSEYATEVIRAGLLDRLAAGGTLIPPPPPAAAAGSLPRGGRTGAAGAPQQGRPARARAAGWRR